jgi:hypothetical protein
MALFSMGIWVFGNSLSVISRINGKVSVFQFSFSSHPPAHALSSLSFLHPFPLSGLVVDGMLFDFLDDGFLLDFSLEPSQRAL